MEPLKLPAALEHSQWKAPPHVRAALQDTAVLQPPRRQLNALKAPTQQLARPLALPVEPEPTATIKAHPLLPLVALATMPQALKMRFAFPALLARNVQQTRSLLALQVSILMVKIQVALPALPAATVQRLIRPQKPVQLEPTKVQLARPLVPHVQQDSLALPHRLLLVLQVTTVWLEKALAHNALQVTNVPLQQQFQLFVELENTLPLEPLPALLVPLAVNVRLSMDQQLLVHRTLTKMEPTNSCAQLAL